MVCKSPVLDGQPIISYAMCTMRADYWGGRLMVGQLPVRQKIRVRFLALPPREVGSRVSRKSSVRQAVCHSEYRGMNPLNTRCNNLQPFTTVDHGHALTTGQMQTPHVFEEPCCTG
jgi:hypothetical protein